MVKYYGFVGELLFKNGESIILTQSVFCNRFDLHTCESVPDRKTILLWVHKVRKTGSALNRKLLGRLKCARAPENIAAMRGSSKHFPGLSAWKYSLSLRISEKTVGRIFHIDLYLHPYKIVIGQELFPAD